MPMKLWRRIVSVLAGTMIASGTVLAAAAILEGAAPTASGPTAAPLHFDTPAARATTQADADAFGAWAASAAKDPAPSHQDRMTAAVGALSLAELTGASNPSSAGAPPPTASRALGAEFSGGVAATSDALIVLAASNSTPAGDYASSPTAVYRLATPFDLYLDAVQARDQAFIANASARMDATAPGVLNADRATADSVTAGEPTDVVGLKASTTSVPQPVANWTASARTEVLARFSAHTLENDTLNLSLASQVLRPTNAAAADALNAELRFRQSADGSIGGVRETAEAVRALAQGGSADRAAAVRALNWLDRLGALSPEVGVFRMRAHAFDGLLLEMPDVNGAPPAPAQSSSAGFSPFGGALGGGASAIGGKGVLALWLLMGGIGLSLSLVTVDALKGARQRLYDSIRASPGLHVNELRRRLHMSPSSIEYHLAVLVGAGLVVAEDDGRYKRYYANGAGLGLNPRSPNSRNALGALRRPHAVALVRALADREAGATARELSRDLAIHESATARRLAHLEDAGVLVSERQGRARVYRVANRLAALKALGAVQEAPPLVASAPAGPAEPAAAPSSAVSAGMTSH